MVGVYKVVSNIWFKIFLLLCVGLELLRVDNLGLVFLLLNPVFVGNERGDCAKLRFRCVILLVPLLKNVTGAGAD